MVKTIDIDIATVIASGPEGTLFHIAVINDGARMRLSGNENLFFERTSGVYMRDLDGQVLRIKGDEGP